MSKVSLTFEYEEPNQDEPDNDNCIRHASADLLVIKLTVKRRDSDRTVDLRR